MTVFYLSVIALFILALAFFAYARFSRLPQASDAFVAQRIKRNISVYKQRLEQLQGDVDDGLLEPESFQALEAEIARELIQSVDKLEAVADNSNQQNAFIVKLNRLAWPLMLCLVLLITVALYHSIGAYKDWEINQQLTQLQQTKDPAVFAKQAVLLSEAIEQRLDDIPEQVDYRVLLASFAMNQQDYNKAAVHYGVLAELLPEDAAAQAYYAQALYLKNGRKIDGDVAAAMDKTLQLDPNNNTVLGLKGISAYESKDYQGAIEAWQQLLSVLNPESEQAKLIQAGVNEAKSHLSQEQLKQLEPDNNETTEEGIWVTVTVSDKVKQLDPALAVFIYAKAANGPKLPLAVTRIQLKDLPNKVFLSDALSMTPAFKLSGFEQVVIGARVSLSGEPISSTGDWFSESQAVNWRESKAVELEINQQVP
jgi:cytochrome c-type biogenesis protein CcmH